MTTTPIISVILPVYNGAAYLRQAIDSILSQTFSAFELIIINDGSRDESPDIIAQYKDSRIRYFSQPNAGLAATLNRAISLSTAEYIARMDQDDISLPQRFSRQVAYLDAHPECALAGTCAEIWTGNVRTPRMHMVPASQSRIKYKLLFDNVFVHSSVMFRKKAVERIGGYTTDPVRQPPEDFELWSRMAREFDMGNIPEVLHIYREVESSMSRDGPSPFLDNILKFSAENIAWAAGASPQDQSVMNAGALHHGAWHKVIGTPDFAAMKRLLHQAIAKIIAVGEQRSFMREADMKIAEQRFIYLNRRYAGTWKKYFFKVYEKAYYLFSRARMN